MELRAEILKIITDLNKAVVIENDKDFDRPLNDFGFDSLDVMTLLFSIQEKYNINIPDEDIERLNTLNTIIEYISEKN